MTYLRTVWLRALLLCGTLDAIYATSLTLIRGGGAAGVWLGVASGPFGDGAKAWGAAGVLAGLLVHFAIMAIMAAVGLRLAFNGPLGDVAPWKAGTLYGLVLYGVMYGVVLQWRFGLPFPNPDKIELAIALFPHIFLVGIPMFTLFKQTLRPS